MLAQSCRKVLHLAKQLVRGRTVNRYLSRSQKDRVTNLILKQRAIYGYLGCTTSVTALTIVPFRGMPGSLLAVITAILLAIFCFAIATGQVAILVCRRHNSTFLTDESSTRRRSEVPSSGSVAPRSKRPTDLEQQFYSLFCGRDNRLKRLIF